MPLVTPQIQNQLPGAIFPFVFYPVKPPKSVSMDSGQSIHSKTNAESFMYLFILSPARFFVSNKSGIVMVKFIAFKKNFLLKSRNRSLTSASSPEQPDTLTFCASSKFPPHTISFIQSLALKLQNMLHFCFTGILKC